MTAWNIIGVVASSSLEDNKEAKKAFSVKSDLRPDMSIGRANLAKSMFPVRRTRESPALYKARH